RFLEPEDRVSTPTIPIDGPCVHIVSSVARLSRVFGVIIEVVLWLRIEVRSEGSFSITRVSVNRCVSYVCRTVVVDPCTGIVLVGRGCACNYCFLRENNRQFELLSRKELVDTRRVAQCAIQVVGSG